MSKRHPPRHRPTTILHDIIPRHLQVDGLNICLSGLERADLGDWSPGAKGSQGLEKVVCAVQDGGNVPVSVVS